MPVTPAWNRAALTSGRRSGRTTVVMSFMAEKATPEPARCQRNHALNARFMVQRISCHGRPSATRVKNVAPNAQIRCHHAMLGHSVLPAECCFLGPWPEQLANFFGLEATYACGNAIVRRRSGHAGLVGSRGRGSGGAIAGHDGGRHRGWGDHP